MDTEQDQEQVDFRSQVQRASEDEAVPMIYFNGFSCGTGPGDVTVILIRNEKPVALLNTSFTLAKTLATKLGGVMEGFEDVTSNKIMTTDDVAKAMREKQGESESK